MFLIVRVALLVLLIGLSMNPSPVQAITAEEAAERYAAYFSFRSLVSGGTVEPQWHEDGSGFRYTIGERQYDFDFATGELNELDSSAESQETSETPEPSETPVPPPPGDPTRVTSPDGSFVANEQDGNIYLEHVADQQNRQITTDGTEQNAWSSYGALWSDDSSCCVVSRYDLQGVATIPLVDWLDPATPVEESPYAMSGGDRPGSEIAFIHTDGTIVTLNNGVETGMELAPLGWHPHTGELLLLGFNRTMSRQDLLAADPKTGSARALISETSETFIDGLAAYSLFDYYYFPVGDDKHFLWLSERDGYHHLYLYTLDGTLVRQLTSGEFPVIRPVKVDGKSGWIYLLAGSDLSDPYSRHLCRVELGGKNFQQLTEDSGRRRVYINDDCTYFVDNHSDLDRLPVSDLRRTDGTFVRRLAEADISRLQEVGWQAPERVVIKAPDSKTDIHAAIYFPPEFDDTKSYPVIEMIYAGPQWPIVPRRFIAGEYGDTAAALAQLGYVTVIIDSRGTQGRSKEFQDYIYGRLGQVEIPDHVAALEQLAADRPWMDLTRVGIHGKSWGGYFSLRAMLQAPQMYKVAVSSSLVADFATTADAPIVPYVGLPADAPEAYEAANCLLLADKLEGKLLMTIGTLDHNTPFAETMRMMSAFIEAGKDVDLLVLPGQNHWLQGPYFERWQRAMRDYFLTHLPPEAR